MLDAFQDSFDDKAQFQPGEGTDLPPSFSESFENAWNYGQMAVSGIKIANARDQAVSEYLDQIRAAGGGDEIDAEYGRQASPGYLWAAPPDMLDVANSVVAKMQASADEVGAPLPFKPMTSDDIDSRAVQISQQAIAANARMMARPQSWGSAAATLLGGMASQATDPYNLPAMALPLGDLGIVGTAAVVGGVQLATQTANEIANQDYNERVQPGYAASGQGVADIAQAGLQGMLFGGGLKALGALAERALTGAWPTTARDIANGIQSQRDILDSNVLPGAEGEAAHQEALAQSIGQVLKDDSVDVSSAIPAESDFANRIGDLSTEARPPEAVGNGSAESFSPDTVRFYEAPRSEETPAQLTPSAPEAAAEAPRYVDIPANHPEISGENAPGFEAASGTYQSFEPSEDLASQLRSVESPAPAEPTAGQILPGSLSPDDIRAALAAPETANAMRADVERAIDQAAQGGKALQSPTGEIRYAGLDKGGEAILEPVFGNVADQLGEVDRMKELAAQIMACATPGAMQEAAE